MLSYICFKQVFSSSPIRTSLLNIKLAGQPVVANFNCGLVCFHSISLSLGRREGHKQLWKLSKKKVFLLIHFLRLVWIGKLTTTGYCLYYSQKKHWNRQVSPHLSGRDTQLTFQVKNPLPDLGRKQYKLIKLQWKGCMGCLWQGKTKVIMGIRCKQHSLVNEWIGAVREWEHRDRNIGGRK